MQANCHGFSGVAGGNATGFGFIGLSGDSCRLWLRDMTHNFFFLWFA
ncbi:hypothetical protein RND59_00565 [Vibrio ruber]|nr:hypothetical protein [Vibrio ruber]WNJ95649.1 hypothetical protein RND59_00565 [Vibrio ruber]